KNISSGDTPEFAVESIERWWRYQGCESYKNSNEILILADSGGSNGHLKNQVIYFRTLRKLFRNFRIKIAQFLIIPNPTGNRSARPGQLFRNTKHLTQAVVTNDQPQIIIISQQPLLNTVKSCLQQH
ncbi:MAG: hypothetical protein HOC09_08825, partial [Deltaproteobacteria bacterium]|nr:hypothetical protein [Deltaproteobacteria bacterium]